MNCKAASEIEERKQPVVAEAENLGPAPAVAQLEENRHEAKAEPSRSEVVLPVDDEPELEQVPAPTLNSQAENDPFNV